LDDSPLYSDYLDFGEIGRRFGGAGGQYFEGKLKQIMIFNRPLTEEELRNLHIWYETQRNWLSVCVVGSSVAQGFGTTGGNTGWAYRTYANKDDVIYSNIADPGKGTAHWISNLDLINERYVQTIHLSLGLGNDSEDVSGYLSGINTIINGIENKVIILSNNYAKGGAGNDQRRYNANKTISETYRELLIINMMGQLSLPIDDFIDALDYLNDKTHPNDDGADELANTQDSDNAKAYQYGTFKPSQVPNTVLNETKYFYKPDALTENSFHITTRLLTSYNFRFRLNCTDDTTGKTLASYSATGLSWKLFLDSDNNVKLTDGTTTITTSINNVELDNFHVYEVSLHSWRALDLYIDGSLEGSINYTSPSNKTITGNGNFVIGGEYNNNANDAIKVGYDTVVINATTNDPPRIAEGYIDPASQEVYITCDSLTIENKSQSQNVTIELNDSNIIVENK